MILQQYLKGKNRKQIASLLDISEGYLNMLAVQLRYPSKALAIKIERETGGQVTRMEALYPDEYKQTA